MRCKGKVAFLTKAAAVRQERKVRFRTGRMAVYACDTCGSWHMGHRPPWQILARMRERRAG